jgi:hypothetical protein
MRSRKAAWTIVTAKPVLPGSWQLVGSELAGHEVGRPSDGIVARTSTP